MAADPSASVKGALEGVKVVDLTRYGAGPICTQILGDMGAEVIKVEQPGGDPSRFSVPPKDDIGGYFPAFNRNKKSVTLDLRQDRGKELFCKLLRWADVLVENFRAGAMGDLGFGYERVREINPRLIMVSISGFGQSGPYAHRAAFDTIAQAMAGMMSITGYPDREPVRAGGLTADMTGGLVATVGALTALYHQKATGKGQHVDASLFDAVLIIVAARIVQHARGLPTVRGESPGIAPYGTFLTRDEKYVHIMAHDDNHWPHMARLMGRADLAEHPGYKTRAARSKRAEELNAMLRAWVSSKTAAEAGADMDRHGIPYGPVQTIEDLLHDAHARETSSIVEVDHYGERLPLVGIIPKLSETPGSIRSVAPHLGQHNEDVYRGILGVSPSELEELRRRRVI